jgi:YjbE family integral membrane protein
MITSFIVGLIKIVLINIVLSGDNAVVIALACRNLSGKQQKKAVFWGGFGAIGLRVILTFIAVWLLQIPFLQVLGGLLLIWIAVKLVKDEEDEEKLKGGTSMLGAIKTIIVADLIMSLDNVVAIAGAAEGNLLLIVIGLAISIPLIIWGSQFLMKLMSRFPLIIWFGAGLLGYTAGEMTLADKAVGAFIESVFPAGHILIPIFTILLVIVLGKIGSRSKQKLQEAS